MLRVNIRGIGVDLKRNWWYFLLLLAIGLLSEYSRRGGFGKPAAATRSMLSDAPIFIGLSAGLLILRFMIRGLISVTRS